MKKRFGLLTLLCVSSVFGFLLTGCNNNSPEIPKEAFKQGQMPPEAQKGMSEAMKKAGPPPTGH